MNVMDRLIYLVGVFNLCFGAYEFVRGDYAWAAVSLICVAVAVMSLETREDDLFL